MQLGASRRLVFRPNPPGRYDGVSAFAGDARVGKIEWCQGRYHIRVAGYGYCGSFASEAGAKAALRRNLRQVSRGGVSAAALERYPA